MQSLQQRASKKESEIPAIYAQSSLKILILQDTGDTRETPAIDVCHGLIADDARLSIYDPQVQQDQIFRSAISLQPCTSMHGVGLQENSTHAI